MKRTLMITAAVAGGIALLLLCGGSFLPGNSATTQTFTPNRYALLAASVDTASQQQTGQPGNPRRVLFKLDGVTGKVWVLQLAVAGPENPTITSASWNLVAESPQVGITP